MATLDELVVRIKADASQLERELRRANGVVQQQAGAMGASFRLLSDQIKGLLPALSAAAFVTFGKRAVDAAGRMTDLGASIGFAADSLSALEVPLAASGASLDQFAASVNLMNANIGQAAQDLEGPVAQAFARLGLSVSELKRLSPEEQFYAIADALSRVGTQYEQTELGRAIFGRGFAALLPLIKDANGSLAETVQALKDTGEALGGDTLARVDAFGDRLSKAAIDIRNEFLSTLDVVLRVAEAATKYSPSASEAGRARLSNYGIDRGNYPQQYGPFAPRGNVTSSRPTLSDTEALLELRKAFPAEERKKPAAAAAGVRQVSDAERERRAIIEQNMTAYEKYEAGVVRANKLLKGDQEQLNREMTRLQREYTEEIERTTKRADDSVGELAVSIRSSLANSFEAAIFDAKNFGGAMESILDGIARQIARKAFIDPLSSGVTDAIGNSGILSGLGGLFGGFFADGGRPPPGKVSVVGERGPELFVPDSAGTVVPGGGFGGVTVVNTWNIESGVSRQELYSLIPVIERRAQAGVFKAIERGGAEARLVGKR